MSQNYAKLVTLEEYRFQNINQALAYYRNCNPCRFRARNTIEPERQSAPQNRVDNHPHDVYAAILLALKALQNAHERHPERYWAFALYHLGEPKVGKLKSGLVHEYSELLAASDISQRFGISLRTAWRHIKQLETEFDAELVRRGIIPPPDFPADESCNTDGSEEVARQAERWTHAEGFSAWSAGSY